MEKETTTEICIKLREEYRVNILKGMAIILGCGVLLFLTLLAKAFKNAKEEMNYLNK